MLAGAAGCGVWVRAAVAGAAAGQHCGDRRSSSGSTHDADTGKGGQGCSAPGQALTAAAAATDDEDVALSLACSRCHSGCLNQRKAVVQAALVHCLSPSGPSMPCCSLAGPRAVPMPGSPAGAAGPGGRPPAAAGDAVHTRPPGCHQRSRVWALQRGAAARPTAAVVLGVLYAVESSLRRSRRLCVCYHSC